MSNYNFGSYGSIAPESMDTVSSMASPAAAAGSGINWGAAGAMAGASALSGIVQAMYQQAQEKKKREQEILAQQGQNAGQYGQSQQNMLGQMMNQWNKALGV